MEELLPKAHRPRLVKCVAEELGIDARLSLTSGFSEFLEQSAALMAIFVAAPAIEHCGNKKR